MVTFCSTSKFVGKLTIAWSARFVSKNFRLKKHQRKILEYSCKMSRLKISVVNSSIEQFFKNVQNLNFFSRQFFLIWSVSMGQGANYFACLYDGLCVLVGFLLQLEYRRGSRGPVVDSISTHERGECSDWLRNPCPIKHRFPRVISQWQIAQGPITWGSCIGREFRQGPMEQGKNGGNSENWAARSPVYLSQSSDIPCDKIIKPSTQHNTTLQPYNRHSR